MFEHYFSYINNYLQSHPYMGVLIAALIALGESLPIVGTIIPGSITMSAIGVLVGRGIIPASSTLFWATFGALVGDVIGFWVGKHYKESLRTIWPFKKRPHWLAWGEKFFKKHGGKSILIGRFVGPARSSVPLMAGLLKMSWGLFIISAVPSAFLWAIAYMLPGVLIGAISLSIPSSLVTKFILISIGVIVLLWFLYWLIQRFFYFIVSTINHWIDRLWYWLSTHHSSFFLRLIQNKAHPEDHHQLTMVLLSLLSLACFFILLCVAIITGPFNNFNEPVFYFLQSLRTKGVDDFFIVLTILGYGLTLFMITVLILIGLSLKRQWRAVIHLGFILIATIVCIHFFKWAILSPRPPDFTLLTSSSFPSGHTTLTVTILGFVAFLVAQQIERKWRWIPYLTAGIVIFLVGFSRLYLGAHWLTDVLGGLFLGFGILLLTLVSYRRCPPQPFVRNPYYYVVLLLCFLVPWSIWISVNYKRYTTSYLRVSPDKVVAFENWWNEPLKLLPIYRKNRFGHAVQPFNIQWAGHLALIKNYLTRQGWETVSRKHDLKFILARFVSSAPQEHFPVFHWLYRQKPPVLLMFKSIPNNKNTVIEIRLWRSGVLFEGSSVDLWIGAINEHKTHLNKLNYRVSEIMPSHLDFLQRFEQRLKEKNYEYKVLTVPPENIPDKKGLKNWDGKILIVRDKA